MKMHDTKIELQETKKPYDAPELVRYGTLEDLTRGTVKVTVSADTASVVT